MNSGGNVWQWRIVWVASIVAIAAFFVAYAPLPVDGATGDLNSFAPQGFRVQWVIEPREGGLQVGDLIVRAGGHTFDEWLDGAPHGPEWDGEGIVPYDIVRNGRAMTLHVKMRPLHFTSLLRHWGIQLAGVLGLIGVGSFVFWRRPENPGARWFMLYCLMNALQHVGDTWNFQYAILVRPAYFWPHLLSEHISYGAIFSAVIMATLTFPKPLPLAARRGWLIFAALILTMLGATFSVFLLVPRWTVGLHLSNRVIVLVASIYLLASCALLIRTFHRTKDPVGRAQIKWLLYTAACTALIGIPFYYLPTLLVGVPLLSQPVTSAIVLLIPLAFATAILQVHLYDIDFIINRSLVYGALTVLLVVILSVSLFAINQVSTALTGSQQSVIAVALSAALFGALFQPARRTLQRFVDRRFYHIEVDYEQTAKQHRHLRQVPPGSLDRAQFDQYTDLEFIMRGGMADIYKAYHPALKRPIAIKILPQQLASDPQMLRRFEREAQILARLKHPNIVQVFDFGEAQGSHYIVMEYLTGPSLAAYIQNYAPVALERALPIILDVASALEYVHEQGLVHRDVKPSNVGLEAITPSGNRIYRAVLMDFGITKSASPGETRLTLGGTIGTFDYIAPEQAQAPTRVDRRADVYSLAVVTYQMLTGQLPFRANTPSAMLLAHLQQPVPDPRTLRPDLSGQVTDVLLHALAKDPDERCSTAREFADALGSR